MFGLKLSHLALQLLLVSSLCAFSGVLGESAWEDESDSQGEVENVLQDTDAYGETSASADGFYYKKRKYGSSGLEMIVMERTLLKEEYPHNARLRRAVPANFTKLWGEKIPYVLHSTFRALGSKKKAVLKRAMKFISEHMCVIFVDETYRYRAGSTTWLPKSKYPDGNFILIKHSGKVCRAAVDLERTTGQQVVEPCDDFKVNLHEMLHMLRGNHMHQGSQRDKYITINFDNIDPALRSSYSRMDRTSQEYFEPFSSLMYGPLTWSSNRLETWTPIRDDIAESDVTISRSPVEFWELNRIYKCAERFCQPRDCGPGYVARVKGVCTCVCPREYDPVTNCTFHVDGPRQNLTWPKASFSLFGAGNTSNSCPEGFESPSMVKFKTFWGAQDWQMKAAPEYYNMPWPWAHIPICTRKRVSKNDWNSWPEGGDFCVIKPKRRYCRGDFSEYTLWVRGQTRSVHTGNVGDFRFSGSDMTIKLCCRGSVLWGWPLDLPNGSPFRLVSGGSCPVVEGMRGYQTILLLSSRMTPRKWGNGPKPWVNIFKDQIQLRLCYYKPPSYGCNFEIALDAVESSITLTTPGYRAGNREPNRRCFYNFLVPDGARVKVTFNDLDIQEEDKMYMRRFHKWQIPHAMDRNNHPYEVVSEKSYLSMEWWSSYVTDGVTNKGVNFTATVLLAEKSCYDEATRGSDYSGDHTYTETFEECLPWTETTDCVDFPSDTVDAYWLLSSGNKCRNPDGFLSQPWCYTFKNGTNCHKRYCDVCNYLAPTDVIKSCDSLISARPDFCNTSISRFGCFKTCNMKQPVYKPATCGPPPVPADGELVGAMAQSTYKQGEHAIVKCSNPRDPVKSSMKCTAQGWTVLTHACSASYTEECPPLWTHHGARCFRYFTLWLGRRQAEDVCRSQGASGTLFQVRDVADQVMLRKYRFAYGDRSNFVHGMWLSGELTSDNGQWVFTDSTEEMKYFNWTSGAVTNRLNHNCIKMTAEYSWAHDAGAWKTLRCDDPVAVAPFVCQTDVGDAKLSDRSDLCQEILTRVPYFCNSSSTRDLASLYCSTSCGKDNFNYTAPQCKEPVSTFYNRTSGLSIIDQGQVMTFACLDGRQQIGGDTARACGSSGALLGAEPVCSDVPTSLDVKLDSLRKRRNAIRALNVYLLDNDAYRIPIAGNITKWYGYCNNDGYLNIIVFKKKSSSKYGLLGSNMFWCEAGYKREYIVPSTNQITVAAGDVIGLWAPREGILSANLCDGAKNEIMLNPIDTAKTLAEVEALTSFSNTTCMVPSFGYRISP